MGRFAAIFLWLKRLDGSFVLPSTVKSDRGQVGVAFLTLIIIDRCQRSSAVLEAWDENENAISRI